MPTVSYIIIKHINLKRLIKCILKEINCIGTKDTNLEKSIKNNIIMCH